MNQCIVRCPDHRPLKVVLGLAQVGLGREQLGLGLLQLGLAQVQVAGFRRALAAVLQSLPLTLGDLRPALFLGQAALGRLHLCAGAQQRRLVVAVVDAHQQLAFGRVAARIEAGRYLDDLATDFRDQGGIPVG